MFVVHSKWEQNKTNKRKVLYKFCGRVWERRRGMANTILRSYLFVFAESNYNVNYMNEHFDKNQSTVINMKCARIGPEDTQDHTFSQFSFPDDFLLSPHTWIPFQRNRSYRTRQIDSCTEKLCVSVYMGNFSTLLTNYSVHINNVYKIYLYRVYTQFFLFSCWLFAVSILLLFMALFYIVFARLSLNSFGAHKHTPEKRRAKKKTVQHKFELPQFVCANDEEKQRAYVA